MIPTDLISEGIWTGAGSITLNLREFVELQALDKTTPAKIIQTIFDLAIVFITSCLFQRICQMSVF